MSAGLGLTLLTFTICILAFGLHGISRKVTNSYIFWFIYSAVALGLFLGLRWIPEIIDYINNFNTASDYEKSFMLSKVYLLDICPWLCLVLHISLIINPSRKFAQILSPIAIFGGLITICGSVATDPNASWSIEYIFYGIEPNRAFFLLHFLNVLTGTLVLLNTPKFTLGLHLWTYIVLLGYILYIALIIFIYQGTIFCNVTGLLPYDWTEIGEYGQFTEIFKIPYPWSIVFVYGSAVIIMIILAFIQIGIQHFNYWKIEPIKNKKWYLGYYKYLNLDKFHQKVRR